MNMQCVRFWTCRKQGDMYVVEDAMAIAPHYDDIKSK